MTWPATQVKAAFDAAGDDPKVARSEFAGNVDKFNQLQAHVSSFGQSLIDDADAAAARTTLGLGTAALKATGTSGDALGLLDAAANWSDAFLLSGRIDPSQITANQNNYNPSGLSGATQIFVDTDASRNVTGVVPGASPDGRILLFTNDGSTDLVLTDQDGASTAANRFLFAGGDRTLTADESVLLRYDGTAARWRAAHDVVVSSGATIVAKTADETVNNSTTLQDDDHLFYAMAANKTYAVDVVLLLNAAANDPDYKFKWTVPASCTMLWSHVSGTTWGITAALLLDESATMTADSINGTDGLLIKAIVRNGANAGNLQLQWAQNAAFGSDSKLLTHSHLIIREIGTT